VGTRRFDDEWVSYAGGEDLGASKSRAIACGIVTAVRAFRFDRGSGVARMAMER
jgi:hypothetical protein